MPWATQSAFQRADGQPGFLKAVTVRELGPTDWLPLGAKTQLRLTAPIGGAFVALVQLEQSLTDPAVSATPVAIGAPIYCDPTDDAGLYINYHEAAGWYRVVVLRLAGAPLKIVLGDGTSAGDVKV